MNIQCAWCHCDVKGKGEARVWKHTMNGNHLCVSCMQDFISDGTGTPYLHNRINYVLLDIDADDMRGKWKQVKVKNQHARDDEAIIIGNQEVIDAEFTVIGEWIVEPAAAALEA